MPKKPLTERFIQNIVAERLNRDYYRRQPAYVDTEVYTRLKRADVFVAFMRARKRPYVVVVEAKSRTTIQQLKLKENPDRVRCAGRLITLGLIVGLSAVLGYQWYFNALNTLLLLGLFVFGSWAIGNGIRWLELNVLSSVGAIEQLARYPANEKWIAIGDNSIVKPQAYRQLSRQCRKSGIGLLVVTASGKLRFREIPRPRHTFNNYLSSYGKRDHIYKVIDKRPAYGPTPPERRKFRRQLLNAGLLVAAVGFLGLLTYEQNYGPVVPDPFEDGYAYGTYTTVPTERVYPEGAKKESSEQEVIVRQGGAAAGAEQVDEAKQAGATACTAFTVPTRSFIVVDGLLDERRSTNRLRELATAGVTGLRSVPTQCLNSWPSPGRQAIYTGVVYPDRPTARAAARAYRALLKDKGLSVDYAKPVKVRPR